MLSNIHWSCGMNWKELSPRIWGELGRRLEARIVRTMQTGEIFVTSSCTYLIYFYFNNSINFLKMMRFFLWGEHRKLRKPPFSSGAYFVESECSREGSGSNKKSKSSWDSGVLVSVSKLAVGCGKAVICSICSFPRANFPPLPISI